MVGTSQGVGAGLWVDYEQPFVSKFQWVVSTRVNTAIIITVGLIFSWCGPSLYALIRRGLAWLCHGCYLLNKRVPGYELPDPAEGSNYPGPLYGTSSTVLREPSIHIMESMPRANPHLGLRNVGRRRLLKRGLRELTALFTSIAFGVCGYMATSMAASSNGLLASKTCGVWNLENDAAVFDMDRDDLVQALKEDRAGRYARACYDEEKATASVDGCSLFSTARIPYKVSLGERCPFQNPDICSNGRYSAIKLSTGSLEASLLGINVASPPTFNRTTICAALNPNQSFVSTTRHNDGGLQYRYKLGETVLSNYTFMTHGNLFNWDIPAYTISPYEASPYPEQNYWTPTSDLNVIYGGLHYHTILFIEIGRIIFPEPSIDPIFETNFMHNDGAAWTADGTARAIACVDWNEVCTYDGQCGPMSEESTNPDVGFDFVRFAMRRSTIYKSIQSRLGNALVAQGSLMDYRSQPLDKQQWVTEVKSLFNTSLARMQYDAYDIATGFGHDLNAYADETPSHAVGKMCRIYKIHLPNDYTNINILPTALILLTLGLMCIMAMDMYVPFEGHWRSGYLRGNWIGLDYFLWMSCVMLQRAVWDYRIYLRAKTMIKQ